MRKGSSLAPVGTISGQTVTIGEGAKTLNLDSYFNNDAGGAVTYTVHSSENSKATTTVTGGTLTMAAAQAGSTTITITAKNAEGATASQAFTLTVNRAPAPAGTIPTQTLTSNATKSVDVSAYFSDADGDTLSYTAISSDEGVAKVSVSGSTVTIASSSLGTAEITVYAHDADATGTQKFSVTVLKNRVPVAEGTISTQTLTLGGSAAALDVSGYFSDPDGDTLAYSASSSATAKATVGVSGSTVTITAVAVGSATITVTASDADFSANQTFTATVVTNQAPTAVGTISAQTMGLRANPKTIDVSAYFSDPDGGTLTYTASSSDTSKVTTGISNSTLTLRGVGVGSSTITVAASDGSLSATQTMAASVTANRGPAAVGSPPTWSARVPTGASFPVSANFSDADGDDLTYTAASADTAMATVSVSGATVSVTPIRIGGVGSTGAGTVKITLTASDGKLSATQQATLTVQPRSPNSAVAASDAIPVQIVNIGGTAKTVDVSSYFSETDGDVMAYSVSSSDAAKATASLSGSTVTITAVAAGSVIVTVTADDGQASSVDQTIVVTVNRVPTTATTMANQTMGAGANGRAIDVSGNFSDADNDTLTYTASSSDTAKVTTGVSGATVTLTPKAVGSATITVTASDSGGSVSQTFTATVQTNNAPTAVGSISAQTVGVGTNAKPIDVSGNFSDSDGDALTYTASSSDEAKATVGVSGSNVNVTGVAAGTATITVTASDKVASATQSISVTVSANRAPDASAITAPDVRVGWNPTALDVSGNFSDPDGDALTYTATSSDTSKATVSVSGSTLTLTAKANGSTTITVTATDGTATVTETFALTVTTNRAPVPSSMGNVTMEARHQIKYVHGSHGKFNDPDGDSMTFAVSSADSHALTAEWSSTYPTRILLKAYRMGTTRVTVTASDGYLSATTGFDVTVTQRRNNKPVTTVGSIPDQSFDVGDSAVTIDVKSKFRDGDDGGFRPDNLVYTPSSSATGVATASASGSKVTVTPVGGGSATITVTADDGQGSSASQTFSVTVNRAPAASGSISGQTVSAGKGSRAVNVSSYFSDADGDTLTYTASSSAAGTATASVSDSNVTISGVAVGSATITVTASDGSLSATQTIAVTVVANQAPLPIGTIAATSVGLRARARTISVNGKFSDPDGDSLTYTATSSDSSKATVSVSGSNLTISSLAIGSSTITVTASDGTDVGTQTFALTVIPNRSPYVITNGGGVDLRVPTGYVGIFSYHIRDPDGDPLTYAVSSSHPNMQTLVLSGPKLTIWPKRQGNATITLTASDGLLSASIQIPLTVRPRNNNKPVQKVGTIPAQKFDVKGNAKTVNVSGYFSEGDNDPIVYTVSSSDSGVAKASLSGTTVTITPVASGTATVSVTADDGNGSSATQTIAVTVNTAPTAVGTLAAQTMGAGTNARTIDVSGAFSDADNDTLTYTVTSSDTANATASVSGSNVTLTPKAVGSATITVTASDSIATATQTISATVVTNQGPTAVGTIPAQTVSRSTNGKWVNVGGNFSDPNGDPLTYSASTPAPHLSLSVSGSSVRLRGLQNGAASVTVTASDKVASATQSFSVTVGSNSGGPSLSLVIQRVALGATPKKVDLNNYCSDPDGDAISYSVSSADTSKATVSMSGSMLTITGVAVGIPYIRVTASDGQHSTNSGFTAQVVNNSAPRRTGTFSDVSLRVPNSLSYDVSSKFSDSDGNPLTYTATSDQPNRAGLAITGGTLKVTAKRQGTVNISVTANDGGLDSSASGPILKLTVQPRNNNKPVSATGSIPAQTVDVGESPKTVDVSSYFSEADGDAVLYTASSSAADKATASVSGSTVNIAAVAGGTATITVTADDGQGSSATQTIAVTVNRGPATSGSIAARTVSAGKGAQTVDVSGNFSDADNDTLTYTAFSSATAKATVSVSGSTVTISGVATGSATITVTASDGRLSATQTIAVTVVTNQTPQAVGTVPAQSVAIGTTPKTVDVGGYFSDPDGDALTYTATSSNAAKATVSISGSTVTLTGVASGSATVTVTASDGTAAATQTIAVTAGTNRAPTGLGPLLNLTLRTPNSRSHDFSSHFSDPDGDPLTFTASSADETKATVSVSGSTVTATAKRTGSTTITVTASDGNLSANQVVPLTVGARENNNAVQTVGAVPPQTVNVGGSAKSLGVASYFSDADGDLMAYAASSSAAGIATASASGATVTITPVAGGTATVTVTADDGQGSSASQIVAVKVNRAPTRHGSLPALTVTTGANAKTLDVSGAFDDPDLDTLSYTATSSDKTKATVSVSGSTLSVTGAAAGSATISVTASDGNLSADQTFTATVIANRAPTAVGSISAQTLGVGTNPKPVDVSANFSDPDGDALTYTASSSDTAKATVGVSGSTVSVSGKAAGSATITVTASDGSLTATQTIAVTVTTNRAPTVASAIANLTLGLGANPKPIDVSANFSDPDGDALTYTATSSDNTKVTLTVSGSTLSLSGKVAGTAAITVAASDGSLNVDQSFNVTVGTNRAPTRSGTFADTSLRVPSSASFDLSTKFSDPDGDALTYTAASGNAHMATLQVTGSTLKVTAKRIGGFGATGTSGTVEITATASDGLLSSTATGPILRLTINARQNNNAVEAVGSIAARTLSVSQSVTIDVGRYFSDADGDAVLYDAVSGDTSKATASLSGSTVTLAGRGARNSRHHRHRRRWTELDNGSDLLRNGDRQPPADTQKRHSGPNGERGLQRRHARRRAPTSATRMAMPLTYTAASAATSKATVSVSGSTLTFTGVARGNRDRHRDSQRWQLVRETILRRRRD